MSLARLGVGPAACSPVTDGSYHSVARGLIRGARASCWCSLFIVDPDPARDPALRVYGLLEELAAAAWRGIDVRLLVGGSRSNLDIAASAQACRAVASSLDVPCRWLTASDTRGSHAKLVIVDDAVLLGSHNWSGGALGGQIQDSVLIRSADLAAALAARLDEQWQRGAS